MGKKSDISTSNFFVLQGPLALIVRDKLCILLADLPPLPFKAHPEQRSTWSHPNVLWVSLRATCYQF